MLGGPCQVHPLHPVPTGLGSALRQGAGSPSHPGPPEARVLAPPEWRDPPRHQLRETGRPPHAGHGRRGGKGGAGPGARRGASKAFLPFSQTPGASVSRTFLKSGCSSATQRQRQRGNPDHLGSGCPRDGIPQCLWGQVTAIFGEGPGCAAQGPPQCLGVGAGTGGRRWPPWGEAQGPEGCRGCFLRTGRACQQVLEKPQGPRHGG